MTRPEHPLVKHKGYIIQLLAEGKNYAQISRILNYSRYAVCRWCFRNNLKLQIPLAVAKKIHSVPRPNATKREGIDRNVRSNTKRKTRGNDDAPMPDRPLYEYIEIKHEVIISNYPNKTPFIEATHRQCSYPLWNLDQKIGDVCGNPIDIGHSYCESCKEIVYEVNDAAFT